MFAELRELRSSRAIRNARIPREKPLMTIRHMRIFITVYQEMNITKAAELLHMTQPAVTRSIKELENYYGLRLFERINHRLYRTRSGDELYARALHIIESFDDLEKGLRNWDYFGVFRVGASITLGTSFLPGVIREFQFMYPHLKIHASISNASNIRQGILDNTLDVALVEGAISSEYICTEFLAQSRLRLILPAGHPLLQKQEPLLKDILEYPLLLRENGSAGRAFLDHVFAAHGLTTEPAWESASTQALIQAVAAGIGISILPEPLVKASVKDGVVTALDLKDEAFVRENYIAWHQQKYLSHTAKEFMELCHRMV